MLNECYSINPKTQQVWQKHPFLGNDEVQTQLDLLREKYVSWHETDVKVKKYWLQTLCKQLKTQKNELITIICDEMGKSATEANAEIEKCITLCVFYNEHFELFLTSKSIETNYQQSFVGYQSQGACLGIMPWNFPFWQVFRFAIPAILAGNIAVLKHAEQVQVCAKRMEELFNDAAEFDVMLNLCIRHEQVEQVVAHSMIKTVSLTGSVKAGKAVAQLCAQYLKPSVLELGGNDAYIITHKAELKQSIRLTIQSRLVNGGQSCIGAKRILVHHSISEAWKDGLIEKLNDQPKSYLMHHLDGAKRLSEQVQLLIEKGAQKIFGAHYEVNDGAYFPTQVYKLPDDCVAQDFDEEIFGPVFMLRAFKSEEEAIRFANGSRFGLGAAIFNQDESEAINMAKQLEAGAVFINDFVKSDPRLPFGGVKESGYGRELSKEGIISFTNTQTVVVA